MRRGLKVYETFANYKKKANEALVNFGKTPMLKFEDERINEKIGGGIAKPNATNIILLYGDTGIGKSILSMNIIASAIREHKKYALILLEDDIDEAYNRLRRIISEKEIDEQSHVVIGEKMLPEDYTAEEFLHIIEDLYDYEDVEIVVLDHIQFLFEATAESDNNEFVRQRKLMKAINRIVKDRKKSIVLISHVNKGSDGSLSSTSGSIAIPQAATKAFNIRRDKNGKLLLQCTKSRYTMNDMQDIPILYEDGFKLRFNSNLDEEKVNDTL